MNASTELDLVTGAFSYTGSHIAQRLLDSGRRVKTLTFHPDRRHPLVGQVETLPYQFDDPVALPGAWRESPHFITPIGFALTTIERASPMPSRTHARCSMQLRKPV